MYIAEQLKKKNVSEYLLYMWQVEDLIRANACDIDKIEDTEGGAYNLPGTQQAEHTEW